MVRQYGTPRHEELRRLLIGERIRAGFSQDELSKRVRWSRQTISKIETGEKRVTVVELLDLAEAIGFDASAVVRRLGKKR